MKVSLEKTKEFKRWKSERMGHPYGVSLGFDAVLELEAEILRLNKRVSELESANTPLRVGVSR